ncbi:MAG: hypothetical protein JWO71_905 [Candidatus Acidoferrum typicum]|nr:hypothetical protein [Candidatus Acidoferrum typicum]
MRPVRSFGICFATLLLFAALGRAGTLHGTVKNGTTGKSASAIEVILIQLQGGMQPVANSKTDAQGQFSFDYPALGSQPMLVRAVYKGINFHQPVPPGNSSVEVSVFEPSKDPKIIAVVSRIVFFQPSGDHLTVAEEYSIQNHSQPPQAYFRGDGNFEFVIPENAHLQQVAASGPTGMPVMQTPIDKGKGKYAIAYALRPGQNTMRYAYEVPYPGNAATLKVATIYPADRLLVVASPTMQISGDGLESGGQEQGMSVYGRENVPANNVMAVNVSGTAPPLQSEGSGGGGGQGGRDAQAAAAAANIQSIPGRLDVLKWPLIAGFVGIFALGAMLLVRKPVMAVAGDVPPPSGKGKAASKSKKLSQVDAAVDSNLDALKDQMFRLELRRQAGTISEEEYAQERAQAEKVLRELVRG